MCFISSSRVPTSCDCIIQSGLLFMSPGCDIYIEWFMYLQSLIVLALKFAFYWKTNRLCMEGIYGFRTQLHLLPFCSLWNFIHLFRVRHGHLNPPGRYPEVSRIRSRPLIPTVMPLAPIRLFCPQLLPPFLFFSSLLKWMYAICPYISFLRCAENKWFLSLLYSSLVEHRDA